MKYVVSFVVYLLLLSIVVGLLDMMLTDASFVEGFFPEAGVRWVVRLIFSAYFTISRPINFKKKTY